MQAEIYFRDNVNVLVNNLTKVINSAEAAKEITDFKNFFLQKHVKFTFVGESETLTVRSDDILYVKFYN